MFHKSVIPAALFLSALLAASGSFASPAALARQSQDAPAKSEAPKKTKQEPPDLLTIHIEVTGGDKNKPVEAASVYIRYYEPHKFKSDKLIEMNVKTSPEGKVRVPQVPKGKILIQVVAEGWKTYGRWLDLTEDEQVFKIHLDKPRQW
jgi:hypothetical protein